MHIVHNRIIGLIIFERFYFCFRFKVKHFKISINSLYLYGDEEKSFGESIVTKIKIIKALLDIFIDINRSFKVFICSKFLDSSILYFEFIVKQIYVIILNNLLNIITNNNYWI
jgi:hypothetical protein